MSLNDLTQRIDRSVYWAIYSAILSEGYIANKLNYENNPAGYNAAMVTISQTKGFAIEIYGATNPGNVGTLKTPRIVMESQGYINGDIGLSSEVGYIDDGNGGINRVSYQARLSDYKLAVNMVSSTAQQRRVMEALVHQALGQVSYIPDSEDSSIKYNVERIVSGILPELEYGLSQSRYFYLVKDLQEGASKVIAENLSNINDITVEDEKQNTINHNT